MAYFLFAEPCATVKASGLLLLRLGQKSQKFHICGME